MERELVGIPFIVLAAITLAPAIMFGWYPFIRSVEKARAVSAITILITSPAITFLTLFWRLGISELKDNPAAGLPFFIAIIETFWIWCASLVVLFVLHTPVATFFEKRRARRESDSEVFE